jgi:two-component system, OmpR family, alkaline phosphatase synthesis response regulator PhoP
MTKPAETILVIEDDASLATGIAHNLRYEGYRVLVASDGSSGLELALAERPDLLVLDLMLPRLSGFDVLRTLRSEGLELQVIILSARGQEADKVKGLKLGADDYLTKPFGLAELLARVEAALRRPRLARAQAEQQPIAFGEVAVHLGRREVTRTGRPVTLTAKEFDLIVWLATHPGRPFSRDQILRQVWGWDYEGTDRTVDNFVRNLRAKLEPDPAEPRHLVTVHGVGYRFEP